MAQRDLFVGMTLALAALAAPGPLWAEDTITSYAITTFGDPPKLPADFKHYDYVNPDAPKGGEMSEATYGTYGAFDQFNPYTVKGTAAALSSIGYESMMEGTADEVGTLYCLLCQSLEYPKDKAWVIFTLRPNITFSDGSPMTAADVAYTTGLFQTQGLVSLQAVLAKFLDKVEVIDPTHVKYTFKADSPPRDRIQFVGGLPVMSNETRMDPGIGSGPYMLDRFDSNQRVIYKRNPNWWGKDLPNNVGRYNFDRIRFEYFGDPTAAFEGFKSGAYLFRNENSSKNWATGYDFPAIQKGWVVKAELPNGNIANNQAFVFNLRRDKFQDPRVREAIGLMFNFEWSNATLFYGLYARINSFWENSTLAATGLPSPEELALLEPLKDKLPPGVLDQPPVMAPVSGPRQMDRGNLRKASDLLDQAGWAVGSDGMRRNAKGETLKVEFLEQDNAFDRIINPYVENLRKLGVDAVLQHVDDAQYVRRSRSHDFDIITDQTPTGEEPGSGLIQYFGSQGVNDAFNSMGLADPAVDALIEKVMQANSKAELTVAVKALDRVLRAIQFRVPEWFKNKDTVAYFDLYAHPQTLPPYALGEMDFWWYDAAKADALKAAGAIR